MNVYFCGRLSNQTVYPKFEKLRFQTFNEAPIESLGIINAFHAFNCVHFIGKQNKIYDWSVKLDVDQSNKSEFSDVSGSELQHQKAETQIMSVEENHYLNEDQFYGQIIDGQSTKSDVIFSTSEYIYDYQLKQGENLQKCLLRNLPKQISGVQSFFKVVQIACGNEHVLLLSNFGHVYSYGNAQNGRLGYKVQPIVTPRSAANKEQNTSEEGIVEEVFQPQLIESIKNLNVKQISCGQSHNLALAVPRDKEYSLYPKNVVIVWGCNVQGFLGIGTNIDVEEPLINTFYDNCNPIKVECGFNYSLVLNENGELTAFGGNEYGQLGIGHDTPCYVPQKINFECNQPIKNIYSSSFHSYAVAQNGNLYGWGNGWEGQLGIGQVNLIQKEPKQVDQSVLSSTLVMNNLDHFKMILTYDQSYIILGSFQNRSSETSLISETSENIESMSPQKPNLNTISPSRRTVTIQQLSNNQSFHNNESILQNKSALFGEKDQSIVNSKFKSLSFFEDASKNSTKPTESPFLKQFYGQSSFIDNNSSSFFKRSPSKQNTVAETSPVKNYLKKQSFSQDQEDYQSFVQQQQQHRNPALDSSKSPTKIKTLDQTAVLSGSSFISQISYYPKVANPVTAKSVQDLLKKKSETQFTNQIYSSKLFKSNFEEIGNAQKIDTKRKRIFAPTTIAIPQSLQQNFSLEQSKKSKSDISLNQNFNKSPSKLNTDEYQQYANRLQVTKYSEKAIYPSQISAQNITSSQLQSTTSTKTAIHLTSNKEIIPKIEKPVEHKNESSSYQSDIRDYEETEGKIEQEKILDQSVQDKIIDELQKHLQTIYIDINYDQSKVEDISKKWQAHLKKKGSSSIKQQNNQELIELFQYGIPSKIRADIWKRCLPNRHSITKSYYKISKVRAESFLRSKQFREKDKQTRQKRIYSTQTATTIICQDQDLDITDLEECKLDTINTVEVDIERTFTYLNGFGKTGTLGKIIRNVLISFVASRPDIGYLQGMSYIASIFAIYYNEFDSFIMFSNFITQPCIMPFYFLDEKSLAQKYQIFKNIFHSNLPNLCDHFELEGVHPRMYMLQWLITIFSNTLSLSCVCLIWDHILLDGGGLLQFYKAGIAMLGLIENQLLNRDFEGIMMDIGKINEFVNDPIALSKRMKQVQIDDWIAQEIFNVGLEYQEF